jgi:hypothetical protein
MVYLECTAKGFRDPRGKISDFTFPVFLQNNQSKS